ncbi:MAG TPA: response regulator transcription factor [Lentibacillus sp.]|uniref:response regulator transcription factor n=1 Tax=Lentibacillus sp. TaxID=1925746 RepID=UPI002B4B0199|nr:response regulator transcription factor [Lentibacillus sp.]HLR62033.1 response regulator transcription factor [Lentibacillus sp.]
MSLTINHQMDSLFQNGLNIVQSHQRLILNEWGSIFSHLQRTGKKSADKMEAAINLFTDYLFLQEDDNTEYAVSRKNISPQINQFTLTLLENAVHKVVQSTGNHSYEDHQAVRYLFSAIGEDILIQPYQQYFSIDSFLKNLVSSNQLPIEWGAVVIRKNRSYVVEKWFNNMSQDLLLGNDVLKADTIYDLSELLLGQMTHQNRKYYNVLPIPHDDVTLLICIRHEDTSQIMPFITYALQMYQNGKDSYEVTKQEQQWKDSVIMFNETIMRSADYNEAVENITAGFVNYLPFERCALFSFSVHEQTGFGLFGHRLDNQAIQNITEDISQLPLVQDNLQLVQLFGSTMDYLQPIYVKEASAGFPDQYVKQFDLRSVVIAPIFVSSNNKLFGAAILDQGAGNYFKVEQETFTALLKFGQSAGEILSKFYDQHRGHSKKSASLHLSPRELEVMKLMADGASTSEAAGNLNLSEYTVRDYISAIMQKMEARNRTEAVARAIREGLI